MSAPECAAAPWSLARRGRHEWTYGLQVMRDVTTNRNIVQHLRMCRHCAARAQQDADGTWRTAP